MDDDDDDDDDCLCLTVNLQSTAAAVCCVQILKRKFTNTITVLYDAGFLSRREARIGLYTLVFHYPPLAW